MKNPILVFALLLAGICFVSITPTHAQAFECREYKHDRAIAIVKQIYQIVLERDADDSGLVAFSPKLSGGGWCIRQVVEELGISKEYGDRFIFNRTPREAIVLMYRHFLRREPESEEVINHHMYHFQFQGWRAKVKQIVGSPEAQKRWAAVRGITDESPKANAVDDPDLVAAGCKYFLGRKGNYLCTTQKGFDLCEGKRKDGTSAIVACQLAGVNQEVDKALVGQGCSRNAVGEYTCLAQKAFDACQAFRNSNKVKVCRRTAMKIGGNK